MKKNPVYRPGVRKGEKRSKKIFDGGIRLVLQKTNVFIILNIYRYMHVKMISANIETSIK